MMNEADQKLVDTVMDWFNFERTAKMMEAVEFGWTSSCEDFCEAVLREWARKFICRVHKRFVDEGRARCAIETGGFRVMWVEVEGVTTLLVEAVLASWDASSDDE